MKKSMTVLMASAECRGVAKVGGLADVVFDLSHRLVGAGHRVYVVLPLYADLRAPADLETVAEVSVAFEGEATPARLLRAKVDGLEVHLVDAAVFRGDGGSVYVDSGRRGKGPFEDDARRFAFFSAAVWHLVSTATLPGVQVVHCHDWHVGLVPLLMRLDGRQKDFRTVFTIHNLDYQGTRPLDEPYAPGASWRQWFPERWASLQSSGLVSLIRDPAAPHCFNPLRCGIRVCDAVNTVSPTYAREITKADDPAANFFGGRGLEPDLKRRKAEGRLWGILNGLDYGANDPSRLKPPFTAESPDLPARRRTHREALLKGLPAAVAELETKHGKRFGNAARVKDHLAEFLRTATGRPLTVCVTRAVSQKLGLFVETLASGEPVSRAFLKTGTALLVIGTGELEEKLEPLNDEPGALFLQCFDAELAHRLYAAGDLFLMPSDFEPCGISQLMALRFGCLPIVHDRGGLPAAVEAVKPGFLFSGKTREAVMLSGDRQAAAEAVARKAGIDTVIAQMLPGEKADHVAALMAAGRKVLMAGDGVNDAPALARADVGLAMATGTDAAIQSAGVTLLGGDLARLPSVILLGRRTLRTIRQNLFWAFGYNLVGLPLAAGLLFPFTGWLLNPVFAGAAMALSSVSVVTNSLRLKGARL